MYCGFFLQLSSSLSHHLLHYIINSLRMYVCMYACMFFCDFTENRFLRFITLRIMAATWSASYTLRVAALIIANLNFASKAKR